MNSEISLRDRVIEAIHTIYDPEIPIDIRTAENGNVLVVMTLTTPNCPSAQSLPAEVKRTVKECEGVTDVDVQITFDPPWDKSMMSEAALFSIGMF
jgi:metal-sulfur cluster biosynthetic enzyme